ncbi:MAG: MBL fold metallo-hydrolase [Pseudomonadota bacterium]
MTTRRDFLTVACSAAALSALPLAATARETVQVVGVARRAVGDIRITALLDGFVPIDAAALTGATTEAAAAATEAAFLNGTAVDTSINAYVIETGDRTIVVDGGTVFGPDGTPAFGPTTGKAAAAFEAAGFDADAVDTLFCTHLHPDHTGFFLDATGARFKNASLALHSAEHAFWTDASNFTGADEQAQGFAAAAQAVAGAYADRLTLVEDGASIAPGVDAQLMAGYTPGHAGLTINSGDDAMLIWGDIIHVGVAQFANPSWTIAFDTDQAAAAATRARVLDQVATDRLMVAGSHIDFPSFGHVGRAGDAYRFVPARWDHEV